jgi:hypothetical protein
MFNLRSLWSGSGSRLERPSTPSAPPRLRPQLEGFEDRTVPHAPVLGPALEAPATPAAVGDLLTITDITLPQLEIVDGVLRSVEGSVGTVTGTLAGLPFTTEITNFALELIPDAGEGENCAILHLELAPIDIDLLGLHVDTSAICLDVTAIQGGGLLGDLLCGLAGDIPLGLDGINLGGLTGAIQDILDGVLSQGLANAGPSQGGAEDICDGECEILDLALGPVDLTLLGLNVNLDDCEEGPVQLCVSASRGEGLLGNLLCGLSGFPNLNLDLGELNQIVDQANDALSDDGDITGRERGQLVSLVNRLARR